MDRRTEDRLIGALSAVVVAGLIVMAVGVAMALTSQHSDRVDTLATASSRTATSDLPPEKQAIVDRIEATREAAVAQAFLHPELLPTRSPGFRPTPTPTTPPQLYGTACTSDDIASARTGENGATGWNLQYFAIVNVGVSGCDLPEISEIDGWDADGVVLFSTKLNPRPCDSQAALCVTQGPLPLLPTVRTPAFHENMQGTLLVTTAWYRCDTTCNYWDVARVDLHFGDAVTVSLPGLRIPAGHDVTIWSTNWVGN